MLLFTGGLGGYASGALSGGMVIIYSIFFFSTDHDFHTFTTVNAEKIFVTMICVCLDISLIGQMYHRLEKNMEEKTRSRI